MKSDKVYVRKVKKPWGYEGNTFRLEDDYARPTETEEMRKKPNRGWK